VFGQCVPRGAFPLLTSASEGLSVDGDAHDESHVGRLSVAAEFGEDRAGPEAAHQCHGVGALQVGRVGGLLRRLRARVCGSDGRHLEPNSDKHSFPGWVRTQSKLRGIPVERCLLPSLVTALLTKKPTQPCFI